MPSVGSNIHHTHADFAMGKNIYEDNTTYQSLCIKKSFPALQDNAEVESELPCGGTPHARGPPHMCWADVSAGVQGEPWLTSARYKPST